MLLLMRQKVWCSVAKQVITIIIILAPILIILQKILM